MPKHAQDWEFSMKPSFLFVSAALLIGASGVSHAQDMQSDKAARRAEHARMQSDVAAQKQQAAKLRSDTAALKTERARCRAAAGEAHAACEQDVQADKAQKQADVAAFRQAKAVHQQDSAAMEAAHQKIQADKRH
jgi:hypothetical protein